MALQWLKLARDGKQIISALHDLGMEVVATGVRKSTEGVFKTNCCPLASSMARWIWLRALTCSSRTTAKSPSW